MRLLSIAKRSVVGAMHYQRRNYSPEIVGAISAVQHGLINVQQWTQLPWWETLAISTIGLRIGLLPLVKYQILTSRRLGAAMPEINILYQLLMQRLKETSKGNTAERLDLFSVFFKGVGAALTVHDVSILRIISYPLINASIFITFIFSVRDLLLHGPETLRIDYGGILWFEDLHSKDRTFVLPLSAVALSYLALDLSLAGKGKFIVSMKDLFQSMLLLSVPFLTNLPSGVFCYWIPNSIFSISQTMAMRSPRFQKFIGIPPLPLKK